MEEQILAAQEAESLEAAHDAEVNADCAEMYEAVAKDIQEMVTAVSQIIQNHSSLPLYMTQDLHNQWSISNNLTLTPPCTNQIVRSGFPLHTRFPDNLHQ